MSTTPIALYGIKILPGEIIPGDEADEDLPFRITMAAVDPADMKHSDALATLKVLSENPWILFLMMRSADSDDDEDDQFVDPDNLSEEDEKILEVTRKRLSGKNGKILVCS